MKKESGRFNQIKDILNFINELSGSADGLTYEDMWERYHWERRTAERVVEMLKKIYTPAFFTKDVYDKKAYFKLSSNSILPNYITKEDLSNLETACKMIQHNVNLYNDLKKLYNKLKANSNNSRKFNNNLEQLCLINGIACAPKPVIQIDNVILSELQNAILSSHEVDFIYKGKEHNVHPVGFLFGNKSYLVASVVKDDEKKYLLYLLHEISNIKVGDFVHTDDDFDINEYAKQSFGTYHESKKPSLVKLLVSKNVAKDAKLYQFHQTQKFEECEDGSLRISFCANGFREIVYHLITWEGEITILSPQSLKDEWNRVLSNLKKY